MPERNNQLIVRRLISKSSKARKLFASLDLQLICLLLSLFSLELFEFKYSGGQKGLSLNFGFVGNSLEFKIDDCKFLLKDTKNSIFGKKSYGTQKNKKSLGGLKACTKYDVKFVIQNVATKKEFNYQNVVATKVDFDSSKLELKVDKSEHESVQLLWNTFDTTSCVESYQVTVINRQNDSIFEDADAKMGSLTVRNLSVCELYSAQVIATTLNFNEKIKSAATTFSVKSKKVVESLKLNIDEIHGESAALSWTVVPEACFMEFKLNIRDVNNKIVYETNSITNSTVISNLTSCSNYSAELIALDDDKRALKAVTKTFVTHSSKIGDIRVVITAPGSAKVIWSSPKRLDCIVNFKMIRKITECRFTINDDIPCVEEISINKASKWHLSEALPLAERFLVEFYVNELSGDSIFMKNLTFNTMDRDKFLVNHINEFRRERTKLQLRWSMESFFMKNLKHFEIKFEGRIIETRDQLVDLEVEACAKNYTIEISCISKDNERGPAVIYRTNMNDDDIPLSSLQDNIHYEQVNELVIISWQPQKKEESCIAYYEIGFSDQTFKEEKTRTEINDFAPCILYEFDITPISHHDKRGITTTFEFTTKEVGEFSKT